MAKKRLDEATNDAIGDILSELDGNIPDEIPNLDEHTLVLEKEQTYQIQPMESRDVRHAHSVAMVGSMFNTYISKNAQEEYPYLAARAADYANTLTTLNDGIVQNENLINVLMQEVEEGDTAPNKANTIGNLQRVQIELIKFKMSCIEKMEEDVKKKANELDIHTDESGEMTNNKASNDLRFRGTRGLQMIFQQMEDEENEDTNE